MPQLKVFLQVLWITWSKAILYIYMENHVIEVGDPKWLDGVKREVGRGIFMWCMHYFPYIYNIYNFNQDVQLFFICAWKISALCQVHEC
jgi:hypothetical protein